MRLGRSLRLVVGAATRARGEVLGERGVELLAAAAQVGAAAAVLDAIDSTRGIELADGVGGADAVRRGRHLAGLPSAPRCQPSGTPAPPTSSVASKPPVHRRPFFQMNEA